MNNKHPNCLNKSIIFGALISLLALCFQVQSIAEDQLELQGGDEPIHSMDLSRMDVDKAMKVISDTSGWNIILSTGVKGQINAFLKNIEVKNALKGIVLANDLRIIRDGNVIKVVTRKEYEQMMTVNAVVPLKYANAEDLAKILSQSRGRSEALLEVGADIRTNQILLRGTSEEVEHAKEVIAQFDKSETEPFVITLKFSSAENVAAILREAFQGRIGVLPDTRTNQVVIVGHPEDMKRAYTLIEKLEADTESPLTVQIFKIQYTDAFQIRDRIEELFGLKKAGEERKTRFIQEELAPAAPAKPTKPSEQPKPSQPSQPATPSTPPTGQSSMLPRGGALFSPATYSAATSPWMVDTVFTQRGVAPFIYWAAASSPEQASQQPTTTNPSPLDLNPKQMFDDKDKIQISVDERTNSLIVKATKQQLELIQTLIKTLDVKVSEQIATISLQYTDPDTIKKRLSGFLGIQEDLIQTDVFTGKITIYAKQDVIENARALIKEWDVRPRQVLIAAKILQVSTNRLKKLGIDWAQLQQMSLTGTIVSAESALSPDTFTQLTGTKSPPFFEFFVFRNRTTGTTDYGGRFSYTALVNALEEDNSTKILSSPKIVAMHGQQASFTSTTKQPYTEIAFKDNETIENVKFADVGVKLTVLPIVSDEGYITMDIQPEISSLVDRVNNIPVIETRTAKTGITMKDNSTIIIAGLATNEELKTKGGFPLLYKVPIINWVLGYTDRQRSGSEVVIIMNCMVIKDQSQIAAENKTLDTVEKELRKR
jgi:type II secretory pathway component GspD/PulD (secretin)